MNIQEMIDIQNKLSGTIGELQQHLSDVLDDIQQNVSEHLECPYRVISEAGLFWSLEKTYQNRHEDHLHTEWVWSEPYEDWTEESDFEIPVKWLQWFVDEEYDKLKEDLVLKCQEYTDRLEQEEISKCKSGLERLVDELGKEAVLDLLYGVEEVDCGRC